MNVLQTSFISLVLLTGLLWGSTKLFTIGYLMYHSSDNGFALLGLAIMVSCILMPAAAILTAILELFQRFDPEA